MRNRRDSYEFRPSLQKREDEDHLTSVGRGNHGERSSASFASRPAQTPEPSRDPIYELSAELLEQAARSLDVLVKLLSEQAEGMREDARTLRKRA